MPPFSHHRPPWWPADEAWPPAERAGSRDWRRMRGRFFWRVGGLFALLFIFTVGGCTLAFWLAASLLGTLDLPQSLVVITRAASLLALLLGGLGLVFTARALRRVTAPLGDLIEAAGRVATGDYAVRVAERGPREIRALAGTFNQMAERLESSDAQRRSLLSDVTHELRTPLTVIQGNLEGLLDGVYPRDDAHLAPILEETRVLSRLIDDLRTLAQSESGTLRLQREPTDVGVLAGEVVRSFRAQSDAAGVAIELKAAEDLPLVEVDPARLREVLHNLIANALRYTPAGGTIGVAAALDGAGRQMALSVSDTGSGIAPEALPHVFDRFYRSEDSPGTGLGLAIAKNLVVAHGGEISAQSAGQAGQGTTIRVALPLAGPAL